MNEEQTKRDYVNPKLKSAGWEAGDVRVHMEHKITDGRIQIGGKRARPKFADYVLEYKNTKLAVIEAKRLELTVTEGIEQAKEYGRMLNIDFVYSTNGERIFELSLKTGKGEEIPNFPTPEELWRKTYSEHNKWKEKFAQTPFAISGHKTPRYYQENAINRALNAIAEDKSRVLLTLATGTGKTYISAQIAYKLYEAAWSLDKESGRRPRILFLADRNTLADQAKTDFDIFEDDQKTRITPEEIRKADNELPMNASVFFTIFQTLTGDNGDERNFEKYPQDFFDLVIIDECHRGGANNESTWREILDYFAPAVHLGLTATPKRKDNVDTYDYFGHPVYEYSLKQGIGDGYLTPFKVKKFTTSLDEFIYTPDNEVLEGEVEEGKIYKESDFNSIIEIKEREIQRVKLMMDSIDQDEKTIVFCANQKHAAYIRDLVQAYASSNNPDYCVRVTANDGKRGDDFLRQFRNNEETIPTILTTSQKLSTGVDAKNLRNIVLFRPVNSMIEFKQIIGRGTRIFEGKNYFTILDFVKAYYKFADPEWDGPVLPDEECKKCGEFPCICPSEPKGLCEGCREDPCVCRASGPQVCTECEQSPCVCNRKQKVKIKLGESQIREMWGVNTTMFYDADGKPISAEQFLKNIFGQLPGFFKDENKLREIWSNPKTREIFMGELGQLGYDNDQMRELAKLINAENSDLFDVFEYIAFDKKPLTRGERILKAKDRIFEDVDDETKEFLEFVLSAYHKDGYETLADEKLSTFLTLKYGSTIEAQNIFGDLGSVRNSFYSLQEYLYT